MICPKCGKPMEEDREAFAGLWVCVDGKIVLNPETGPPFKRKCSGLILTKAGADLLDAEVRRLMIESN